MKTLRVYVFHPQLLHRQLFDFRFRPQTGSGLFSETGSWKHRNRKSKLSLVKRVVKFCCASTIFLFLYFDQGRRQRLLKIFDLSVRVYGHTGTKMILASTRIEKSKNEDRSLNTKIHGLLNEILFGFLKNSPLPVWGRNRKSKGGEEGSTLRNGILTFWLRIKNGFMLRSYSLNWFELNAFTEFIKFIFEIL